MSIDMMILSIFHTQGGSDAHADRRFFCDH